jgi:hypothetical protein
VSRIAAAAFAVAMLEIPSAHALVDQRATTSTDFSPTDTGASCSRADDVTSAEGSAHVSNVAGIYPGEGSSEGGSSP